MSDRDSLGQASPLISDLVTQPNVFSHETLADQTDAVLATEIYAVACRNAEIGALTRANTAELMRIVSTATGRGRKARLIAKDYRVADLTGWVIALIEAYIGRIAAGPALKPRSLARVAKKQPHKFLVSL